jgi:hypothetical protein
MPKRSNAFQPVVTLLETALASGGASVKESVMMKDSRTGEMREVDIVIQGSVGSHKAVIGIEVVDRSCPASTPWVESMFQKHVDLPIDKTILVSRSGFYAPALEKARLLKMDTFSFEDIGSADWGAKIAMVAASDVEHFLLPVLKEVTVFVAEQEALDSVKGSDMSKWELYGPSGEQFGSAEDFVRKLIATAESVSEVRAKAFTDCPTSIQCECNFQRGTVARLEDKRMIPVSGLKFLAVCHLKVESIVPMSGRYGDVAATYIPVKAFGGTGEIMLYQENGKSEVGSSSPVINRSEYDN